MKFVKKLEMPGLIAYNALGFGRISGKSGGGIYEKNIKNRI
jgi:hypothetical protein